jgi:hypothetical protein
MNPMRERRRATISELRQAIECLPRSTRLAMLDGIERNEIIAGAYSDSGGICPMLAAHRAGGRTDCIAFAKAWDRFAFSGSKSRRARRATKRELLILRTHLEASLLDDDGPAPDLAAAMAEHRVLVAQRPKPRPGDPDRNKELRNRPGWAWTRIMRRYDEYERALQLLESQREHVHT